MLDKQETDNHLGEIMEDSVISEQKQPDLEELSVGDAQPVRKNRVSNNDPDIVKTVIEELHDDTEIEDDGLPIDRGWAWVITFAAFHNFLIIAGYNKAMGLLFIEFLILFKSSTTETALIVGVMAGVFGISVFITMQVLVSKFKIRYIVMLGGFLSGIGIILSVFATNLIQLILTQSVFVGMGNSMVHAPALVLIGKYFKNKRSTAAAIAASAVSAGAVIFPHLVKYLIDEYGLRGALLILGGIHLHILVAGLLMVPIESFKTRKQARKSTIPRVLSPDGIVQPCDKIDLQLIRSRESLVSWDSNNKLKPNSHYSPLLLHRPRTRSNASRLSDFTSQTDISTFVPNNQEFIDSRVEECENPFLKGDNRLKTFFNSLGFYLWKKPLFLLLNSTFALNSFLVLFLNYYPAYVVELGTSEQDAANILSIAGAVDFFCRLGAGLFADLGYMKRTHICAIAQIVSALNCHLLVFYSSYHYQIIGIVLFGMFSGVYNSFIPVLIMDFLGMDDLAKALGFVMITHGAAICAYHPIVGALKDYTGTYIASFHCMGACVILSAVLLLMEPLFRKCKKSQETIHTKELVIG
ncbi:hypothetical protein LOTGIDRAFT_158918 [Lottia gigantea]|uniref:Major facilitator superfamily (MFS) profile domain-containing protein n=1 Tax=Lottia gigantea TaxID=225164 RepID=V4AVD1_LOTGI|nr:hypothetical protein LOTGIDRAFT_158918 [Lottia gigantea]ESO98955.1 hypothetical protein LOTGIDRAFT_158918 [Lottia gigantea]